MKKNLYIHSSSHSPIIAIHLKLPAQNHHCFKLILEGRCLANEKYQIDLYKAIDQPHVKIGNVILS